MALIPVSSFWRQVSVRGAIADFRVVVEQAGHNRWRIAVLSALMTGGIFSVMFQEKWRGAPPPPKIDYITTFRPDRSQEEIVAANKANQRFQDRLRVEQAKRDEEVRQVYVKLGRVSGMDVDEIERRAAAELSPQQRAEQDRLRRLAAEMEGQAGNAGKR